LGASKRALLFLSANVSLLVLLEMSVGGIGTHTSPPPFSLYQSSITGPTLYLPKGITLLYYSFNYPNPRPFHSKISKLLDRKAKHSNNQAKQ